LNIFIRFGDIRRRTSNSSEIGPNFACFWPLKFFWGVPPKFWTGIIKFSLVLTTVQNFTPVGPRISEKKKKKTSAVKHKSFRKLSFSGELMKKNEQDKNRGKQRKREGQLPPLSKNSG